jgi:hypothetical protein
MFHQLATQTVTPLCKTNASCNYLQRQNPEPSQSEEEPLSIRQTKKFLSFQYAVNIETAYHPSMVAETSMKQLVESDVAG